MIRSARRAKIVATIGPASSDVDTIENLIKAGVNVFRFNFSHGKKEDHKARFDAVRTAAKKLGTSIAILQDLQGPKLRVGSFPNGSTVIEKGEEVVLRLETKITEEAWKADRKVIPFNYEKLPYEVKVHHRILLDDGNMEIVVTRIEGEDIIAQVVFGGILKDKKGMNYPDTRISIEAFTPKDREDLLFGMQLGVDYVAISFVRTAEDIRTVQKFMHSHKVNIPIVAKIEKGEAITNLKEILDVTDCVMVARGDLAVEVGTAPVPSLQKLIIRECKLRGIPVITATQMLESMITTPRPTRAEASDVANAVIDGTDAVMLSAESASGKFPVLAVSTMHNIILETELRAGMDNLWDHRVNKKLTPKMSDPPLPIVEAIEHAAANIATWVDAKAIVCTTHTGRAARALARYRPARPIVAFTDDERVQRQLALVWGIESLAMKSNLSMDVMIEQSEGILLEMKAVEKGDLIVFTAGWPALKYGTTNFLKIITIQKEATLKKAASSKGTPVGGEESVQGYRTRSAQFIIDQKLCIQCGGCVEVCPMDIFGMQNRKVYLKEEGCKNCVFDNACMEICPTNAIEIMRLTE